MAQCISSSVGIKAGWAAPAQPSLASVASYSKERAVTELSHTAIGASWKIPLNQVNLCSMYELIIIAATLYEDNNLSIRKQS